MNIGNFQISKKSAPFSRVKGMLLFSIILLMITPSIPVYAEGIADHEHPEMSWKDYPYQPPGTDIVFPKDEGSHDKEYAIEWWYANFHLTGQSGNEYGAFVAFYQIQSTVAEKQEVRIFSISDVESEKTYTNAQIGTLVASNDHLDLSFEYFTSSSENINQKVSATDNTKLISANQGTAMKTQYTETSMKPINKNIIMDTTRTVSIQKTNTIVTINGDDKESANELQYDHWYTKSDDQGLLPFQYSLIVNGNSQQDQQPMKLIVDMDCLKKPLLVGGDGIIYFGNDDFSYYYSLTRLAITGTITVHGITEDVIGFAWIDHQWGNFVKQNPPPGGLTITYEWFSIQFEDHREMMVGDAWDRETGEKIDQSYTGGLNLVNSDESSELLEDYTITPLASWNDIIDHRFYSCNWRITETSKSIDLIATPVFLNQVMRVKENYPLLQQLLEELFPAACFWEGACTVSGTINGDPINGVAYVELTHNYPNGDYID